MTPLTFSDKLEVYSYRLLATNVSKVLRDYSKTKKTLSETQKNILSEGSSLLLQIVNGATLVNGDYENQFTPTKEGLSAFGYALSAAKQLNIEGDAKNLVALCKKYQSQLADLRSGTASDITALRDFFRTLGNCFQTEIDRGHLIAPQEEIR